MRDALTRILLVAQCSPPPEHASCSFWGLYLPMTDHEVFTFSDVCIFYSRRCCRLLHVYTGDALLCEMLSLKLSIFTALTNEAWYLQIFIAKSWIEKNLLSFKKVSALMLATLKWILCDQKTITTLKYYILKCKTMSIYTNLQILINIIILPNIYVSEYFGYLTITTIIYKWYFINNKSLRIFTIRHS